MILTSYGVRLPIFGDGLSDRLKLDLRETLFLWPTGTGQSVYGLIPEAVMPHRVLDVTIGGPSITVQTEEAKLVEAELDGHVLTLNFSHPLYLSKEAYTVEIVFGRIGIPPDVPEVEA